MLKLELEAAEFEDSGFSNNKQSILTIGTPLMPYTEPSFVNEGIIERIIEEKTTFKQPELIKPKKRSRHEFEASKEKPLLNQNDKIEKKVKTNKSSSMSKTKYYKHILMKAGSP